MIKSPLFGDKSRSTCNLMIFLGIIQFVPLKFFRNVPQQPAHSVCVVGWWQLNILVLQKTSTFPSNTWRAGFFVLIVSIGS